jgi:hypothetical protein
VTDAPDPTSTDRDQDDEQVILGVDTHADAHVAAVITVMGCCWAPDPSPPRPPAIRR